jgi:integrative and conjugative element protein (TIGR02256 family)
VGAESEHESPCGVIRYAVGASGQSLHIADDVLDHFNRHRQTRFWRREAGGLLFARFDLPIILIEEATGPRRTDRRTRYSYSPDIDAERREIERRFAEGLHFVGCWHTHPEQSPTPSQVDIRNTAECVRRSRHALNSFVMAIVGQAEMPQGLFVSVCDQSSVHRLTRSPDIRCIVAIKRMA